MPDELLGSALDRLGTLDLRLVAVAIALQLANVGFRTTAWWGVLRAAYPGRRRVPFVRVGCAYASGMAANALLPARGGDGVKAVLVRSGIEGSTIATIVATMAVTAAFDGVLGAIAMIVAWATGAASSPLHVPQIPPAWLLAAAVAPLAAVAIAFRRRVSSRARRLLAQLRQGGAILSTPRRYAVEVALPQAIAWGCRLGVVFALLRAFHIPASAGVALAVLVLGGVSSALPVLPGGAGAQQVMVVYALRATASAAVALSFSLGMQVGITTFNAILGLAALALLFRTLRPIAALRASRSATPA
jgi:uncharacterized membrane protein YbhN (UPF0104 family)